MTSDETDIIRGISASPTIIGGAHTPLSSRPEEGVTLAIAMTPRSEHNLSQQDVTCVPYTPHGDEAAVFKYYCPLCMQYFRDIMKMKCCGNYMCVDCCKDYVRTKQVDLTGLTSIGNLEERFITSNTILCPHCQVNGFHPMSVSFEELVRDYSTRVIPAQNHSYSSSRPGFSPLRVGESFEDLKRKMIPYKSTSSAGLGTGEDVMESAVDTEVGEVCEYVPDSPIRHSSSAVGAVVGGGEGGIAMTYYGDTTPITRSPRLRLEPDTPECQPSYTQQLFTEDMTVTQATHDMEEKSSEHSFAHRLALSVPGSHGNGAHMVHNEELFSPNEIRFGSPSPRLEPSTVTDRQHSSLSLRISPRNITTTATSLVCMKVYASGMVEELLRTAVVNSSTQQSTVLCTAQQ